VSAYRSAGGPLLGALLEDIKPPRGVRLPLYGLIGLGGAIDVGALLSKPSFDGWLVVAFAGILMPFVCVLGLLGNKYPRIRIYEEGLIVGEDALARWDDIVEIVTTRVVAGRRSSAVMDLHALRLASGSSIDAIDRTNVLLAHLRKRTRDRLLTDARQKLAAGPLTFGRITVDAEAVFTDVSRIQWGSIEGAHFDGPLDSVVVHGPRGAWIEAPLHEVPNAHVLIELVKERVAT
jgi:hypothetical protein